MQVAIPKAPRKVSLQQVPGAVRRLAVAAAVGIIVGAAVVYGALSAGRFFSREQAFLRGADEVQGRIARVTLPPLEQREGGVATLDVLYAYQDVQRSVRGVQADALWAEGLGPGAAVALLVDPKDPDHPREAGFTRARGAVLWLLPAGVGLGVLLALGLFAFELRRMMRAEVEPLRTGALVWLTPDEPLPESKAEVAFSGSYFREDVKHTVRVRGRPGRAPVKNGSKVLAAVVPRAPTWARLVDEDLARTLGWIR